MAGRILSALEPVDSDVDLGDPVQRQELRRKHGTVLLVIAAGGVLGALARFQFGRWWPTPTPMFPWTTLLINVTGCLIIGAFTVLITERWSPHRLVRPFFGTGILGGYTTFSTYAVDIVLLIRAGHPLTAALYLLGTLVGAFATVTVAILATRKVFGPNRISMSTTASASPAEAERRKTEPLHPTVPDTTAPAGRSDDSTGQDR